MLYPGPQLRLLILLALTLLVGLGVREWRAGFPDAAERLERFDREDAAPLLPEAAPAHARPGGPVGAGARVDPDRAARAAGAAGRDAIALAADRAARRQPRRRGRARAAARGGLAGIAQRIVEERERRGRFDSPEALRYVLGMGPKKLAAIRPFITVRD